jgi:serine/threonine-protein kinase
LVAIYDQGNDATHPFLVMELVDGGTLRELLRERGPMPPHAVAAVLHPVLGGLGVAHQSGLVHRDIKPENVLISDDGEVKLVDFGLVRAIAEAGITSTSVILGTAGYLSPEQVEGAAIGPRSDVYSAGIMAFELLTGTSPFRGDNVLSVAHQRLDHDVPPPSSMIDGVPQQFDDFVAHATARRPEDRFPDAVAMGEELDSIADELGLPAFRVPAPRNSGQHTAATVRQPRRNDRPPSSSPNRADPAAPDMTRQYTPQPQDRWSARGGVAAPADDAEPFNDVGFEVSQFAGIDIEELAAARQRGRRAAVFWTLAVLVLNGLVAAGAWSLGTNFQGLLPH